MKSSIRFDVSFKRQVEESHRLWAKSLPKTKGQIGEPITGYVEAPPTGSDVNLIVQSEFVKFLKKTRPDIPF
jgi:hypothetical protein